MNVRIKNFFHNKCSFYIGANSTQQFPDIDSVEIALVGRSNVGKSSLINAIMQNKSLARISKSPGCTAQINFFKFDNYPYLLVDLPGYGYAEKSKKELKRWSKLIDDYLKNRTQLQCIFILVDSRRGLKDTDIQLLDFTKEQGISCVIILTKIDKISNAEHQRLLDDLQDLSSIYPNVREHVVSSSASKKLALRRYVHYFSKFFLDIAPDLNYR